LGRLHPKKKPKFLVDAFLNAAPQHYRLVMAGPDEMGQWSAIEESLRTRSAMHRVVATGPVSGAAKAELYSAATLFALPSINENFGLTVLEALSAGTPVLSSPHVDLAADAAAAGLAETLPLDSSLWEERLARLPASEPAETEFASRARAWVAASYSWDRISARFIERYGWVLEGRT
jgi:glycosyltransferase involved in cell wall biosynthesis